jgi:membrane fusion protein (multidrug efflux system)
MKKALFASVVGLLLIFAGLAGVKALQIRDLIAAGANMAPPPTAVASELVQAAEWASSLSAVGELEASRGVVLTADLAGRIASIAFEPGARVQQGDLLVEQEVSSEQTELEAAEADKTLARSNLNRASKLLKDKLIPRSDYDAALAAYRGASARVQTIRASLDKKQIVAPFDGRLGLSQVDLGQNISAGTPIVSLQAIDRMYFNFSLPQRDLTRVTTGLLVTVAIDALPDQTYRGEVSAINSEIDKSTRTVEVQAVLDNPQGELLPGMFGRVEVSLGEQREVLIIPAPAISYASFGDSVFVLEPPEQAEEGSDALVARQQFVQLGEQRGDYVEVTRGLAVGERVASAGAFKLRNGAPVSLNESVKPEYQVSPSVTDQ